MKNLLVLFLASLASSAWALPLAYDGFNDPLTPTNLTAQTAGLAWQDAGGAASITNRPYIEPGSLSYSGLAPSVGNSVHFGGRGMSARAAISPIYSNTVYYSFILKITDLGKLGTGAAGVFFAAVTGGTFTGTEPNLLGAALLAKKVGPTQYVLGIKKAGAGAAFSGNSSGPTTEITNNVGDVVLVVASYTFVPSQGKTNDEARLWINPAAGTLGGGTAPLETVLSTGSADLSVNGYPLNGFTLFNRQALDEPGSIIADEVTVGTTWADVTPTASALAFISQPNDQRSVAGGSASFSATTYRATTNQWQHNGADIPGANSPSLNLTNIQVSDAGTYRLIIGNGVTSQTSSNGVLRVYPDIYPRLVPLWSLAPGSRKYLTTDGGNAPNQRSFAYNALSNQVLLVSRTNTLTSSTNPAIYVLHGDTGADLYQMNTDPGVITGGANNGSLSLNCIDVSDDGSVFAANVSDSTGGFNLYYWTNSDSGTPPQNVLVNADPSQGLVSGSAARFGDSLAARGAGPNTQIMVVNSTGICGSVLTPQSGQPLNLANWNTLEFTNASGGNSGGRTLLFFGNANTVWEKYGGSGLELLTYDTTFGVINSSIITNFPNLVGSPNLVAFDANTNMLLGIEYNSSSSAPDTLDQYDLSDPSQPLFVRSYSFPVNHQANANGCGRVVVNGDRVYALDSNNGMVAYRIEPVLSISPSGANVVLAWPGSTIGYTLQATPSLNPPVTWTNVSTGTLVGQQFFATNSATAGALFYRLQK